MPPKTVFTERCAVTAFDMKVQISEDGRDRGLWVWLDDDSEERQKTYHEWLHNTTKMWWELRGQKPTPQEEFGFSMFLHNEVGRLLNFKVHEGALLEWPEVEKLHKKLGEEISRAKKEKLLTEKRQRKQG